MAGDMGLWRRSKSSQLGNRCQSDQDHPMSRQTMSFALPESMREYIDNRGRPQI